MRKCSSSTWSFENSPPAQPAPDPLHGVLRFGARARIAQADELAAMHGVEIEAGGHRHMRLGQHALRKIMAVGGEARDVGIEVEGAVRRQEAVEPGPR